MSKTFYTIEDKFLGGERSNVLSLRLIKEDVEFEYDMIYLKSTYERIYRFQDDSTGCLYDIAIAADGKAWWGGRLEDSEGKVTNPELLTGMKSGWESTDPEV